MNFTDSGRPEFSSARSYQEFAQKVRRSRRFVWDEDVSIFLETVLATTANRDLKIPINSCFWRAQIGVHYNHFNDSEDGEVENSMPLAFSAERMKLLPNSAQEGRVNSKGIPVLYLATTQRTAISEVRPWIGSEISVAQVKILRDLKAIDLSLEHGKSTFGYVLQELLGEEPLDASMKEKAVWTDIDNSFSEPVTLTEDTADYVPTQILAEQFLSAGYEAICCRSQFDEEGHNVVLFDLNDAKIVDCAPTVVDKIEVTFRQMGNAWYTEEGAKLVG